MKSSVEAVASDRVWFLASGTKKVGPMSEARVLERLASGNLPSSAKAWKEGMDAWLPVREIPELSGATKPPAKAVVTTPAPDAKLNRSSEDAKAERPVERRRRTSSASGQRLAVTAASFTAPHRIERADLWRAFEIGFDRKRVTVALAGLGAGIALLGAVALATWLHPILGVLGLLACGPITLVISSLVLGALSYQTRKSVEGGEVPGALEALGFAKGHVVALAASPVLAGLMALVPPVLLLVKSVLSHVPVVGPAAAGLTFGIDLALSASAFFLVLAASLAWHLVPAIVAFEETGVVGTLRGLLATVRSRFVRLLLWPTRPLAALSGVAFALLLASVVLVALPALLNAKALGLSFASKPAAPSATAGEGGHDVEGDLPAKPDLEPRPSFDTKPARPSGPGLSSSRPGRAPAGLPGLDLGKLPIPSFEPSIGLAGVVFWVLVLLAVCGSLVLSTANALGGLLYLACRSGNDDLVTRDDALALARKTEVAHARN